jgi:flagellar hook-associated protein 3 FlgL
MRISTLQIYQQGIEAFGKQQTKLSHLQQQISSGVRITKPSDDPAASARVLQLEQTVSLYEQYNVNVTLAENRLKLEETILDSVENIFFRIKELSIQANGPANDASALRAIAAEVEERYKELLNLANAQDGTGNHLFGGFQSKNPPFVDTLSGAIRHVEFQGDQGQRSFQISETRQIVADDSGSKIFMAVPSSVGLNETSSDSLGTGPASGLLAPAVIFDALAYDASSKGPFEIRFNNPPTTYDVVDSNAPVPALISGATYVDSAPIEFEGVRTSITGTPAAGDVYTISPGQYRDVFATVRSIVETLNDGGLSGAQRVANIGQAQLDLEAFFTNVLEIRTSIGGRLNALETQFDDNIAYTVTTRETLSTLRDTDLAEAISQLTVEQTTLDAAQAVFARISSSSLFNFIR